MRSKFAIGALVIRSRCARGTLQVRSKFARGTWKVPYCERTVQYLHWRQGRGLRSAGSGCGVVRCGTVLCGTYAVLTQARAIGKVGPIGGAHTCISSRNLSLSATVLSLCWRWSLVVLAFCRDRDESESDHSQNSFV